MCRILIALALGALCVFAGGCRTTPWVRGEVVEGFPRHTVKFPSDVAFYLEKTEPRVKAALDAALRARGFIVVEEREACDFLLEAKVDSWEYNDAGFAGMGRRDDMSLTLTCIDRRKGTIRARSQVIVRSDFRIFEKYVETL